MAETEQKKQSSYETQTLRFEKEGNWHADAEKQNSWDIFYGGSPLTILPAAMCAGYADKVKAAENLWVERQMEPWNPIKFFTLGAVTYIDMMENPQDYEKHNKAAKDYLLSNFSGIYDSVCKQISSALGGDEVVITEDIAPPGFHIYKGNKLVKAGLMYGGPVHRDYQHAPHAEKFPDMKKRLLSFTLPIELPKGTAGMYYWKGDVPDSVIGNVSSRSKEEFMWLELNKNQVVYELGQLVMHDGTTAHQISSLCDSEEGEWRITMQGHGIYSEDKWHLYF